MKYFYDCEFIEDGCTIDLVSIGIVAEDGREYYAVSSEFDMSKMLDNPWLVEHVLPQLPIHRNESGRQVVDRASPLVRDRALIADQVRDFLLSRDAPELWGWYSDYDHVALCQLWGSMVDLPDGIPMYTRDLKQQCDRLGNPDVPGQPSGEHNALADAQHNRDIAEHIGRLITGAHQ